VTPNINNWWWRARMWLATTVAPRSARVCDRDRPIDEELLSAICWYRIREGAREEVLFDVTAWVDELVLAGLVTRAPLGLTEAGEKYLARLWGDDVVAPGSGGYYGCHDHGVYDAGPGDPWRCPECPSPRPRKSTLWGSLAGLFKPHR
jgi:hypothetical protein